MTIAIEQLYRLLNRFEQGPDGGAALSAYICPAGVWTIAYGCTKHPDGTSIKEGDTITPDQVYPYTEAAVERVIADIRATIKRPLNQYQEAAVASFVFNLGIGNLRKSTQLLPAIEAGRWEDAATALGEFVRAWGHFEGKWHRQALLGLRIRRYAEGLMLLGLDFDDACNADNIGMPKRREWQAEGVCPDGSKGRWYDVLLDGATEFNTIEEMARANPLPPLDLVLTTKAEPAPSVAQGKAGQPEYAPQPAPAAPAPVKEPAKTSSDASVASKISPNVDTKPAATSGPAAGPVAAPSAPQVPQKPLPVPVPRLPDPPIPIGQQTSAVDAARKSEEWSSNTKAMWQSRRFYGLVLIMAGRLWMLKTGSNAFLGAVSDPLVMEFVGGFCVMIAGELVQAWGRKKATRALH